MSIPLVIWKEHNFNNKQFLFTQQFTQQFICNNKEYIDLQGFWGRVTVVLGNFIFYLGLFQFAYSNKTNCLYYRMYIFFVFCATWWMRRLPIIRSFSAIFKLTYHINFARLCLCCCYSATAFQTANSFVLHWSTVILCFICDLAFLRQSTLQHSTTMILFRVFFSFLFIGF